MKNSYLKFVCKLAFIFSITIIAFLPLTSFASEKIDDFYITVKINKDASIDVSKKILYDFGSGKKHGIYSEYTKKLPGAWRRWQLVEACIDLR